MIKYEIGGAYARGAEELSGQFGFECGAGGIPVVVKEGRGIVLSYRGGTLELIVSARVQVFFALKYFSDESEGAPRDGYFAVLEPRFALTYMLDCSRNAVPREETLFELIRHLAVLGYNALGLYMEDTFAVPALPYFGYLRNPFTREEIARTEAYCDLFGIELVPYIQTLAHFNTLTRHPSMQHLFDCNDILLVGEEPTYAFLETLIAACASYFKSREIHIGMDEAYMLGRGVYMDRHGARNRFDVMMEHLSRVLEICKKYGYEHPMMWSDMFFSLTMDAQYGGMLPRELAERVPRNVELVYWDYCSTSAAHYMENLHRHRVFRNEIAFAGGAWKWLGYTPDNRYAIAASSSAARACRQAGVRKFIVTGWGDNGAECSVFATLPALHHCSRLNLGFFDADRRFERAFLSLAGLPFKDFMKLDLANRLTRNGDVEEKNSANKFLLFNDVLLGTLDTLVPEGLNALYREHAARLARAQSRAGKWDYLFETQYALCRLLSVKAELGIKLRAAYRAGDREKVKELVCVMKRDVLPRLMAFYRALRAQWERENRPNGFDVQDIRLGALERRIRTAIEKTESWLCGEAASVPELEEELLCFTGHGKEYEKDYDQCEWRWRRMSSVNVNE